MTDDIRMGEEVTLEKILTARPMNQVMFTRAGEGWICKMVTPIGEGREEVSGYGGTPTDAAWRTLMKVIGVDKCVEGHPFAEGNAYWSRGGGVQCRECNRDRARARDLCRNE